MYAGNKEFPKRGQWQEAIVPSDVDEINREEDDEHFTGLVPIKYRSVEKKRGYVDVETIETKRYSEIVETKAKIKFKEGDKFINQEGVEFEILEATSYVEDKYKDAVRVYPGLADRYKINRLFLK
jgi:hypothetical protein